LKFFKIFFITAKYPEQEMGVLSASRRKHSRQITIQK